MVISSIAKSPCPSSGADVHLGAKKTGEAAADRPANTAEWKKLYLSYMADCSKRQPHRHGPSFAFATPHQLVDNDTNAPEDVILAIAAFWQPLVAAGKTHAFGDSKLFLDGRNRRQARVTSMFSEKYFILPLFMYGSEDDVEQEEESNFPAPYDQSFRDFQRDIEMGRFNAFTKMAGKGGTVSYRTPSPTTHGPEHGLITHDQEKSPTAQAVQENLTPQGPQKSPIPEVQQHGPASPKSPAPTSSRLPDKHEHVLLAICERTNEDGKVRVNFYGGAPSKARKASIRRVARSVIRNSGWTGEKWPTFEEETWWPKAPSNAKLQNSQIRTILNAWTWMLEMGEPRTKAPITKEFYAEARKVINFAMAGKADRRLVECFMQTYGFVNIRNDSNHALGDNPVQSVLMNKDVFSDIIENLRTEERALREFIPTWKEALDTMMAIHDTNHKEMADKDQFKVSVPYINAGVVLAIGSLWRELRHRRSFAFAELDLFERGVRDQSYYDGTEIQLCGFRHQTFIMPMFFPSEEQKKDEKSKVPGHLLLGIAAKTHGDKQNTHIRVYDSSPGYVKTEELREEVSAIFHRSDWLEMTQFCSVAPPHTGELKIETIPMPRQSGTTKETANMCGLHVILTAWALLLEIPLHHERKRREGTLDDVNFYKLGNRIVELAVAGCMDSRTIQAFLNVAGMSVVQDINNESDRVELRETSAMKDEILRGVVTRDREKFDDTWAVGNAGKY